MYGLVNRNPQPTAQQVEDQLDGNLCRFSLTVHAIFVSSILLMKFWCFQWKLKVDLKFFESGGALASRLFANFWFVSVLVTEASNRKH